jgi:predicted 3-demethylubiquinone-9 3-methyltransferase (glyoxalase superfamily)
VAERLQKITPFLWFEDKAEEAANYYVGIFRDSKVHAVTRYTEVGKEQHRRPPGSVMTVEFDLEGQRFTALNGGPVFQHNPAISFVVHCQTQDEVDYYWDRLTAGGDPKAQQCGWLRDKFGLSWQVVPAPLIDMIKDPDKDKAQRAFQAMLQMRKLDLDAARRAYEGAAQPTT